MFRSPKIRRLSQSVIRTELLSTVVYAGEHADKIRLLRRVSLFSSVMSGTGLPLLLATSQSSIDPIAQVIVAVTALITTASSTLFIHICTKPYVVALKELSSSPQIPTERTFEARQLNLLGMEERSVFKIGDIRQVSASSHPFASFSAGGKFYYVSGDGVQDPTLKAAFTLTK